MAPIRNQTQLRARRRSSIVIGLNPLKSGSYGIKPLPKPVTFAPNVTPGTYAESDDDNSDSSEPAEPTSALFPPSEVPPPPPARRRVPPGKRLSQGYIPRPPNAFMLFRAEFVRQKHVPGSIEASHGSLSKIIGNCWRSLPPDEKKIWEKRAKLAKADHKIKYPHYRYRPVHNKHKACDKDGSGGGAGKKAGKSNVSPEEERRCEEVAQLLLEGKKGDELAEAVRVLDEKYKVATPTPAPVAQDSVFAVPSSSRQIIGARRSSSVPPLMNGYYNAHAHNQLISPIAVPSAPFLTLSRPHSPAPGSIARWNRLQTGLQINGGRRPSSVQPIPSRSWLSPAEFMMQPENGVNGGWGQGEEGEGEALPEVDTSLFRPEYFSSFPQSPQEVGGAPPFNFTTLFATLPPTSAPGLAPNEMAPTFSSVPPSHSGYPAQPRPDLELATWIPNLTHSEPSSAYSGSPTPSEPLEAYNNHNQNNSPTPPAYAPVVAPQPTVAYQQEWKGFEEQGQQHTQQQEFIMDPNAMNVGVDMSGYAGMGMEMEHMGMGMEMEHMGMGMVQVHHGQPSPVEQGQQEMLLPVDMSGMHHHDPNANLGGNDYHPGADDYHNHPDPSDYHHGAASYEQVMYATATEVDHNGTNDPNNVNSCMGFYDTLALQHPHPGDAYHQHPDPNEAGCHPHDGFHHGAHGGGLEFDFQDIINDAAY